MNPPIFCFTLGLTEDQRQNGAAVFEKATQGQIPIYTFALQQEELEHKVEEVVGRRIKQVMASSSADPPMLPASWDDAADPPASGPYRVVLIHAPANEMVIWTMRSFKHVLPEPQTVIFAAITETALGWTFSRYFSHLGQEYEYMQTHNPADDPDMKQI